MALTPEQRTELEALGPETVRVKLIHGGSGRGADVPGFAKGALTRGDIEDWLVEKYARQVRVDNWTLWAAIVGAVAATIGVLLALHK
jgi:hypothetical protein